VEELSTHKSAPIEDWPDAKARNWLQHGLLDQIEDFVARAKDNTWTLDVAIYEYEPTRPELRTCGRRTGARPRRD